MKREIKALLEAYLTLKAKFDEQQMDNDADDVDDVHQMNNHNNPTSDMNQNITNQLQQQHSNNDMNQG